MLYTTQEWSGPPLRVDFMSVKRFENRSMTCKEVMTDQPPKGPVVYSLRNGNAHYIGATIDLDRRIQQHNGAHRTAKRGPGWRCTWYVDEMGSAASNKACSLNMP